MHLTPASTILAELVARHGRTRTQGGNAVGEAFGFRPDLGVAPANAPASAASLEARLAGLRAAAFSPLTQDLGLAAGAQFDLLAALAEDPYDGALDGAGASTVSLPEDVQNRFARALTDFLGCPKDHTGLDPGQSHRYVWHCHIIDQEDNEIMRPCTVQSDPGVARTFVQGVEY